MDVRTPLQPRENPGTRPAARRWQAVAAWVAGGLALFAFSLRISFGERVDSDGANSALQAWDLVHGHLMLHGWIMGDATFYAFELPLNGIVQLLFGVGSLAAHIGSALTYLIVAACAVALAVTGSRGPARASRLPRRSTGPSPPPWRTSVADDGGIDALADKLTRGAPAGDPGLPVTVELSGGSVRITLRSLQGGPGVE